MKIDHIALQVDDIAEAVNYYREYGSKVLYQDETWAFLQFDNIKLAFVVKTQHPAHIAFEVNDFSESDKVKLHRDSTTSVYKRDPWGNIYELIKYPQ